MAKIKCPKCAHLNDGATTRCSRCETLLPSIAIEKSPASHSAKKRPSSPEAEDILFHRGQVVNNRYTVLDLIGRGGMGCIYKVHDNVLGEDLALKTLLPQFVTDKMVVERFLNEARITRKLAHPNIVRVHDIGMTGKGIYISMEYVQGESLRAILEKQRTGDRLPVRQVLHIIDQLCVALDYAHQYTIHRDIKPENVMITRDNHIKLMDFGISKLMDNRFATSASIVMGTPYYMSPEQQVSSKNVDARADIYSVGVVLYEMLTGNMPTGVPKPASEMMRGIPPALDDIVARCVEPVLSKRFESVAELRAAIRPIIEMLDEGKAPAKILTRKPRSYRPAIHISRTHLLATACLLMAFVGISAGLWALERWNSSGNNSAAPVSLTISPEQKQQYEQLMAMIVAVQHKTADLNAPTKTQREHIEAADAYLKEAEEKSASGDTTAFEAAETALQRYLVALLARDDMVFIPEGHVTIDGKKKHVPPFFIDRTEVSIKEFKKFCLQVAGGWSMPERLSGNVDAYLDYPLTYAAWFDAQAYAAWCGKTLPTREQWACAAYGRDDASELFPWGEAWKPEGANMQTQQSWEVAIYKEDRVKSGCVNMAGNVREWTRSRVAQDADGPPDFGEEMVVCGGSFLHASHLRDISREFFETRKPDLGFRCVLEIDTSPAAVAAILEQF